MPGLLGATGSAMMRLARNRMPVPPGFTISSDVGAYYAHHGGQYPAGVWDQIRQQIQRLETLAVHEADEGRRPLILRLGADSSAIDRALPRPLTIGFNDRTAAALARVTGDECAAFREYAKAIREFAIRVAGIDPQALSASPQGDSPLILRAAVETVKRAIREVRRRPYPQDPMDQLRSCLGSIYDAWAESAGGRAASSRSARLLGVAVTVTVSVFGDMGEGSVAGVACSRNPADGSPAPTGRWTSEGGNPIDAGRPLVELSDSRDTQLRAAYKVLIQWLQRIEMEFAYPQDVEFVVERGRLWIVHASNAARAPEAGLRWAADMAGRRLTRSPGREERKASDAAALLTLHASDVAHPPAHHRTVRPSSRSAFVLIMKWAGRHSPLDIMCEAGSTHDARAARDRSASGIGLLRLSKILPSAGWRGLSAPETDGEGSDAEWRSFRGSLSETMESMVALMPGRSVGFHLPVGSAIPGTLRDSSDLTVQREILRAVFECIRRLSRRRVRPRPAIVVPVEGSFGTFDRAVREIDDIRTAVFQSARSPVACSIHAWMSTPRDALRADVWAESASGLVFPVAELDRWLRGERCDAEAERRFDAEGVGTVIETGIRRARGARPDIHCGLQVDHVPDPGLIRFCHRAGIQRLICPPEAAAAVRLVAAQAAIRSMT